MKLTITHQTEFSKGELLLRTFFGLFYIVIPYVVVMFFILIAAIFATMIAWFSIVFRGIYPRNLWDFQIGILRWDLRVNARILNLADGYPAFGIYGDDEHTSLEVAYPEQLSSGMAIVKLLFGWLYCAIPHLFVLGIRSIWTLVLTILAFWQVLFTGKYSSEWHEFNVGTLRWNYRLSLYLFYLTDEYPPFSGKE